MTPDKMSAEEINRAIAEELGWKRCRNDGEGNYTDDAAGIYWRNPHGKAYRSLSPPDFVDDLNACAEMECSGIPVEKATTYDRELGNICARDFSSNRQRGIGYNLWHATAPQRCEAFLRTVGKWRGA